MSYSRSKGHNSMRPSKVRFEGLIEYESNKTSPNRSRFSVSHSKQNIECYVNIAFVAATPLTVSTAWTK